MTNGFRGLLVGWGEPIYVKLKEVEKLAVRHFKMGKKKHKDDPPPDPDSLQVFNRKVSFNLTVNIWEQ